MPMFRSLRSQLQCLVHKVWWCMSPQKLLFCYHFPLEDEQELSLGMLIRCKRIYNFWYSMLVLHQLSYVLSMLRYTFYAFSGTNLLTRCHSASSCFLLLLVSETLHRKYFYRESIFLPWHDKVREGNKVEQQGDLTHPRCGLGLAHAWVWWGPPGRLPASPLRLFIPRHGKTLSTRAQFHEKHRRRRHRQP